MEERQGSTKGVEKQKKVSTSEQFLLKITAQKHDPPTGNGDDY